jgi:hypothetical protein
MREQAAEGVGSVGGSSRWREVLRAAGGRVTITMPDGEVLHGEYQMTENAARYGLGLRAAALIGPR